MSSLRGISTLREWKPEERVGPKGNKTRGAEKKPTFPHQMVKPSGQSETDTKQRILDAADEIFVRRGIDGARMQEIADHAGVNKALLHYYFRSKADLARAVWLRIASSFVPGILEMLASDLFARR